MRYFRVGTTLLGVLITLVALPTLGADADPLGLRAIRDQAHAIETAAGRAQAPAWLRTAPDPAAASAGAALGQTELDRQGQAPPSAAACEDLGQLCGAPQPAAGPRAGVASSTGITYTVFVSRALGAEALRAIFRGAIGADVRVVFRGINPGERMMDAIHAIQALLKDLDPLPTVELDPTPFRDAGITVVPVISARDATGEVARVSGLSAPDWLRAQLGAGTRGDLGVRGPVVAISEPDLIEAMQRRVAALDLNAMREAAIGRYWQRAAFEGLPAATAARERTIDPTITASADLILPDGTALIRAGDTVNPLDRLPFTHRLVIFDASDPRQVEIARRLGESAGALRPLYLATAFDRIQGWEGLRAPGRPGLSAHPGRARAVCLGARTGHGGGAGPGLCHQ
ncbi:TrbC family F-type conjugative pilus assembly protein [uncultured Thiodictyon sp.]|uniref:TrbC family F-type conjugative pilus assembly protein n=1 Tax=uncultured Thiodictyon sp. TaxID=1846217 RepID=UPI0025F1C176|nr:TrbC family F-type conjugative pilus assembly protein [uncultured Thiodictyon sp.]